MATRLTLSLCQDAGDVYVEARAKQPLPVAALETTQVQFNAVLESQSKIWLPNVRVGLLHLWKDSAAHQHGLSFEGASGVHFLDISQGSAARRRLESLLEQESFRVVWPVEGIEVSRPRSSPHIWEFGWSS
jgi:hypothetical protein